MKLHALTQATHSYVLLFCTMVIIISYS